MQKQSESETEMACGGGKKQLELSLKSVCLSCHMHTYTDKHRSPPHWMCVITSNVSAVREQGYWLFVAKRWTAKTVQLSNMSK